jgi:hypothetical protein
MNKLKKNAELLSKGESTVPLSKRSSRPPQEVKRVIQALSSSKALFDSSCYPKFSSLISTNSTNIKPQKRPLSWLLRIIEEIYDARYVHDTSELTDSSEANKAAGAPKDVKLSKIISVFVMDFFVKKYGLKSLVDQTCWDLLYNLHALRKDHLEAEVFGRFLEETYDPDDMLFFLYVRSVVQRELGFSFRSNCAELGERDAIFLSFKSCVSISKLVFGAEAEELLRNFLAMIESHLVGRGDQRKIEVYQFLHLVLAEYHDTRPRDGDEGLDEREESDDDYGLEEEDEDLLDAIGPDGTVDYNKLKEISPRFSPDYDQFELNNPSRGGNNAYDESPSPSYYVAASKAKAAATTLSTDTAKKSSATSNSDTSSDAVSRGRRALLQALGLSIGACNSQYLAVLLEPCKDFPEALRADIHENLLTELENKIHALLETILTGNNTGAIVLDTEDKTKLQSEFASLLSSAVEAAKADSEPNFDGILLNRIDLFCQRLLEVNQLRSDIERLASLLVSYAETQKETY